jgi:hypothetical protein
MVLVLVLPSKLSGLKRRASSSREPDTGGGGIPNRNK